MEKTPSTSLDIWNEILYGCEIAVKSLNIISSLQNGCFAVRSNSSRSKVYIYVQYTSVTDRRLASV